MALFGMLKKEKEKKESFEFKIDLTNYEIYKTADFTDEKNDGLLEDIDNIINLRDSDLILHNGLCEPLKESEWNYKTAEAFAQKRYVILYNFLTNVASEELAAFVTERWLNGERCTLKEDDARLKNFEIEKQEIKVDCFKARKFLQAWSINEAINPDNVLKKYFRNDSFKKLIHKISFENFIGIYNLYVDDDLSEDVVDDDSIIYNADFAKLYHGENSDIANELLEIDRDLRDAPDIRKKILYKDGDSLRMFTRVKNDYEEYKKQN